MAGPLSGMRVVDLCRLLPGDFATWVLADLGAEVIKIEDLQGGDYMRWMPPMAGHSSAMFWAINRGKRSLALDLKRPEGRELFLRLADTADAVVESFRPGVMDRLGVGWEVLSARNPGLVYCAITGYGQDGVYAQRAGHDLDYISLAGLQGITGTTGGELAIPGFQVADLGGGGMNGALSVLAALLARERDPERRGAFLDVSMFDAVSAFVAVHALREAAGAEPSGPSAMHLNGLHACYHLYRAGDGRWLALGALEPKFWRQFCELIERPDLVDRGLGDPAAVAETAAVLAARSRDAWLAAAEGRDVCLEPVNTLAEAMADPHARDRGLWRETGEGLPQPAPLVRPRPGAAATPEWIADPRVPRLGEDTRAILAELGCSEGEVESLVVLGVAGAG